MKSRRKCNVNNMWAMTSNKMGVRRVNAQIILDIRQSAELVEILFAVRQKENCCCWFIVLCTSHWLLGFCVRLVFLCITLCPSSFAIILTRESELVALLLLSFGCLVTANVLWLSFTVPWVGLQFVIVVFPDHTHLLFYTTILTWFWHSIIVLVLRIRIYSHKIELPNVLICFKTNSYHLFYFKV